MDWMRRNWPDLLIGVALVAVIAGIIATLITGGSIFPLAQRDAAPTPAAVVTPAPTPAPGPTATIPDPQESAPATTAEDAADAAPAADVAVLPPLEQPSEDAAPAPAAAASPVESAPAAATAPAETAPAASADPTPAAASSVAVQTGVDTSAPFRVSVGAFGNSDNATRQADRFRDAGYPVFVGQQGDLSLVLVGPYDSEAEANAAAERIRQGDFNVAPVIYRFQPDAAVASATPAPVPTTTTGSGQYFQVGAYGSSASAQPFRDRLEGLGYPVSERTEGGLVKLLVGPYPQSELGGVSAQLEAQGIDHFPR